MKVLRLQMGVSPFKLGRRGVVLDVTVERHRVCNLKLDWEKILQPCSAQAAPLLHGQHDNTWSVL